MGNMNFQMYYLGAHQYDKTDKVAAGNKVVKVKREGEHWNFLDLLERTVKEGKEVTRITNFTVNSDEDFAAIVSECHFGDLVEVEFSVESASSAPRFERIVRTVKKSPFPPLSGVGGFEKKKSAIEDFDALGGKI